MIAYRDAVPGDRAALAATARACFTGTFGHLYSAADLDAFLDGAFGPGGLPDQVGDPAWRIRLALDGERIVGFAKLGANILPLPSDVPAPVTELHQLYVLADWHGAGVGPALMDWATKTARAGGHATLSLSVYVDNVRARAFYARRGFVDVGRYDFSVGSVIDEDRMMVLPL